MPLLKIYVDSSLGGSAADALAKSLSALRDQVCAHLQTEQSLCQFSVIAVQGLPDQALVSAEINIMPAPERTKDHIVGLCELIKHTLMDAVDAKTAVRCTTLVPQHYVALR